MATVKSGINKVGNSYYQSITTDTADGSVGTTMYRVNADGSGGVPIYDVDKSAGSNSLVKSFDANATEEEKKLLSNPNSQLSQVRSQQIKSSNPYGSTATAEQKQSINNIAGKPNEAITTDAAKEDGSVTTEYNFAETDKKIAEVQKAITAQGRDPTKYSDARYPLTLDSKTQDCIKFTVLSHSPQKVSLAEFENGGVFGGRGDTRNRGGTVTLPIQPSITDTNSVNWGGLDVDAAAALSSAAAASAVTGAGEGVSSALEGGAALLQSKAGSESIKSAIALGFVSTNKNFFTKATGAIANPNLELLFQGPNLRQFTFNFVMSAREKDESKEIKKIIRFFKQAMSVKRSNTALFLKSPHTFEIKYLHKNNEHPYLNKIKECALLNFAVDYTPAGNYTTYDDGAMTLYALSMTFQELDPIYDDDYTKLTGGDDDKAENYQIGY